MFCALSFPKSLFAVQWSVLCMARGLDAVFYEFSGIIIRGILTNHNARNNGDLFTCNDFNVWVENVYMKSINY